MKKNKKNNNQLPPHVLGYWVKGLTKDGMIIKKKIIHNIEIKINITETKEETDDDDIIYNYIKKRLRYSILTKCYPFICKWINIIAFINI